MKGFDVLSHELLVEREERRGSGGWRNPVLRVSVELRTMRICSKRTTSPVQPTTAADILVSVVMLIEMVSTGHDG